MKTGLNLARFQVEGSCKVFDVGIPIAEEPIILLDGNPVSVGINGIDYEKMFYWRKGDPVITTNTLIKSEKPLYVIFIGEIETIPTYLRQTNFEISLNSPNGKSYYSDPRGPRTFEKMISKLWQQGVKVDD